MKDQKTLLIVESPSKAKTIQKYLGDEYIVLASYGHIADLCKNGDYNTGIDIKTFTPRYTLLDDKVNVLEGLFEAANKCNNILLAQDMDREGEAISWHLQSRLQDLGKPLQRITFGEITKKSITEAIKKPRDIDLPLVHAQEARRMLDRLVGFMASPFLMNTFGSAQAGGRVQSVITRMIVDKEKEIESFQPEEYWIIKAHLQNNSNENFWAKYNRKVILKEDAEKTKHLLNERGNVYIVSSVVAAEEKKKPAPPLITTTMQQVMSKSFNLSSDKTMKAAQSLYEAGYITYIRTDSIRTNLEFLTETRNYLLSKKYEIPKSLIIYEEKENSQGAHESIHPTNIAMEPNNLLVSDPDQKLLYEVIWRYFLASQMLPAIYNTLKVSLHLKSDSKQVLKASGKALKSLGFLEMLNVNDTAKIDIPNLIKGEELTLFGNNPITIEQKFTQPPARFSEAHLLETLEKKNIGRPATYADLLSKITLRDYVEKRGNVFHPTELGKKITDELTKHFSFMEYNYTSQIEARLDQIAEGKVDHIQVLKEFFAPFKLELDKAYSSHGAETCATCQNPMIIRNTRDGKSQFYGCIRYPICRGIKSIVATQISLLA